MKVAGVQDGGARAGLRKDMGRQNGRCPCLFVYFY